MASFLYKNCAISYGGGGGVNLLSASKWLKMNFRVIRPLDSLGALDSIPTPGCLELCAHVPCHPKNIMNTVNMDLTRTLKLPVWAGKNSYENFSNLTFGV